MEGDSFWMTTSDRKKLYITKQVIEKKITQLEASMILGISLRQMKRLCKAIIVDGDRGVIHKSRGRRSNHSVEARLKERVLDLCKKKYKDFGPTLVSEQLRTKEGIFLSDETIRLWMNQEGIPYRRRKERPHRQWRERKAHCGEMLQIDGSHHDWLEGRGRRMVMMAFVDDATGRAFARFYDYEGTLPAFDGFLRYVRKYGVPCSVYLDRHSAYKGLRNHNLLDELEGKLPGESQFQRAMKDLAVEVIHANSPQAKGRVERFFRTVQDRLVKEMRTSNITTLEEANAFLSYYLTEHNRKFAIAARNGTDLHRPLDKEVPLKSILAIQSKRFLRNDFTVLHNGKLYQVLQRVRTKTVTVEERISGQVHLSVNGIDLPFKRIPVPPKRQIPTEEGPGKGNRYKVPKAANHPFRNFLFGAAHPSRMAK